MIRKQFKLLFVFDATTTSNQEPTTCLPNGSKSNWPTRRAELTCTDLEHGAKGNEHTSWPEVAFGHCPSTSAIDGSPKAENRCCNSCCTAAVAVAVAEGPAPNELRSSCVKRNQR
ncbi:uncharacterized protein LOC120452655 [Drosophila santomea]|uniref:uncharacterized protein LOC120452655 n=1 Tax=Drosophila santomea TaxID=129105 RepID=UPI0019534658|nr:uncharacterized protein LOC120452655 [Drosophila santomea]XP_039492907.1 uncharacterized protein LOC120452655 [Drosophila santomea]